MSKLQWTLLTLSGIIFVVSVNVWMIKRDVKGFKQQQSEEVIYKQLPVIPFSE